MQFIDLKKQYQILKSDIQINIDKVLEHGQYIMGPEVAHLEEKLARIRWFRILFILFFRYRCFTNCFNG